MSEQDLSNEELAGMDEEVENPQQTMELESVSDGYEAAGLSDDGSPGEVETARALDGTGMELAARQVLALRGIEVSALLNPGALEAAPEPTLREQPRDVVEASLPGVGASHVAPVPATPVLESVIGTDERVRIFDTNQFPYSAIAALEITAKDGTMYVGTAWFVSETVLITAGHCVFVRDPLHPGANGWVRSIRVIPGRNGRGPGSEPFRSVTATRFRSVAGWVNHGRAESDYGAIFLPAGATPNGKQVGTFGLKVHSDDKLSALHLNVAGYPADKKGPETQTLWYDVKKTAQVTARQVFYDADTYGGQSGAPVFEVDGTVRRAVAIHAYGISAGVTSNSGTRITTEVFNRIQQWKNG